MSVRLVAIAFLAILFSRTAFAEEHLSIAGLRVAVWVPAQSGDAKAPVVIFSHGFHGCATQSRFLATALAKAGYLVFAPNHRDATCDGGAATLRDRAEEPFTKADRWSDAVYRDRADDIRRLLAALEADQRWSARADWERVGLAGHSLGGYTVLGLAGAWPSWRLDSVKAVLALSPYDQPFVAQKTLGGLAAPVMYQGGTRDLGITPSVRRPGGGYDQSPAPKYFVEFDRAGHLAWSDFPSEAHAGIVAYALAFLDRYLKGDAAAGLTRKAPGVADLRYSLGP
jgi:predicted dienelactone hydrolase